MTTTDDANNSNGGDRPPYMDTPLPEDSQHSAYNIVLTYLAFHCYSDTVQSLLAANNSGGGVGGGSMSPDANSNGKMTDEQDAAAGRRPNTRSRSSARPSTTGSSSGNCYETRCVITMSVIHTTLYNDAMYYIFLSTYGCRYYCIYYRSANQRSSAPTNTAPSSRSKQRMSSGSQADSQWSAPSPAANTTPSQSQTSGNATTTAMDVDGDMEMGEAEGSASSVHVTATSPMLSEQSHELSQYLQTLESRKSMPTERVHAHVSF